MKIFFILIVFLTCNSCSIFNPCSDYDYKFPEKSEYVDCYRIMEDLMNDPDLILSICDESDKCTDFIKRKLERGVYRIRYKWILGKHARCNSSFMEEIFTPVAYQSRFILIVRLETIEGKVIEFSFIRVDDTWKLNRIDIYHPR